MTSRDPGARGSHVSLRHAHGYPIVQALIARGMIGDFRAPDILRFGFAPLYLSFADIWRAVELARRAGDAPMGRRAVQGASVGYVKRHDRYLSFIDAMGSP